MKHVDVIRAWKDEAYRLSLTDDQRSALPENPAGMIELTDLDLSGVAGGGTGVAYTQASTCASGCTSNGSCSGSSCVGTCSHSCEATFCNGCNFLDSATTCVQLPIRPILYLP